MRRILFILPLLVIAVAGCHDNPSSPPAPMPAAAFTVGGTQQVGQATTFDASGSTDPGGGGLSYTWEFGDGARGGTATVAHLYAQAGTYSAQLTVRDAAGKTATATKAVTIAAGLAASGTADVGGRVFAMGGAPLAGVTVAVAGTQSSAQTDAQGVVVLNGVPAGVPLVLSLSRAGYADGSVRIDAIPPGMDEGYFQATLTPRQPVATLASAQAGGSVGGPSGARVVIPAGALVRADGSAATGSAEISITPVDVTSEVEAFPGTFTGVGSDGNAAPIATLGVMEVELSQGGQPLRIAPGYQATIDIPIYTGGALAGQAVPLWSLDEATGLWVQEGTGTVVASAASPTGLVLRGSVSHFSWWNVDIYFQPFTIRVKCFELLGSTKVPLSAPCWVFAKEEQGTAPRSSQASLLSAGERRSLPLFPGVSTRIHGVTADGNVGSVLVSGAAGQSQDLDVVVVPIAIPPIFFPKPTYIVGKDFGWAMFNGVSLMPVPTPLDGGHGNALAWNGSVWVAGGLRVNGISLISSVTGVAWTGSPSSALFTEVAAVAAGGTAWVAVGSGSAGGALATSPDGQAWTQQVLPAGTAPGTAVAWNGLVWLAGFGTSGLLRSANGTTWTAQPSPFTNGAEVRAIAWNGDVWLVIAQTQAGPLIATSADGATWTTVSGAGYSVDQLRAVAWNGASWLVVGDRGALASTDGVTWAERYMGQDYRMYGVTWTGDAWQLVGEVVFGGAHPWPGSALVTTPDLITGWGEITFSGGSPRAIAARRPVYPPLP
jgi:PKD repeat protein